eukprot:Opistho-2@76400
MGNMSDAQKRNEYEGRHVAASGLLQMHTRRSSRSTPIDPDDLPLSSFRQKPRSRSASTDARQTLSQGASHGSSGTLETVGEVQEGVRALLPGDSAPAPEKVLDSSKEATTTLRLRLRRRRDDDNINENDASAGSHVQPSPGKKRRKVDVGVDVVDPALSGEIESLTSSLHIFDSETVPPETEGQAVKASMGNENSADNDVVRAEDVSVIAVSPGDSLSTCGADDQIRKLRHLASLQLRVIRWQQKRLEVRAAEARVRESAISALEGKVARLDRAATTLRTKKLAGDDKIAKLQLELQDARRLVHALQHGGGGASGEFVVRSHKKGESRDTRAAMDDTSEASRGGKYAHRDMFAKEEKGGGDGDEDEGDDVDEVEDTEAERDAYEKELMEFSKEDGAWIETTRPYFRERPVAHDEVPTPTWSQIEHSIAQPQLSRRGRNQQPAHVASSDEDTSDEAVERRHRKLEMEERRSKRWDAQLQRERRMMEASLRFSNRKAGSTTTGNAGDTSTEVTSRFSFTPDAHDALVIRVAETVPLSAFGAPLPPLDPKPFSLPTKGPNSCRRDMDSRTFGRGRGEGYGLAVAAAAVATTPRDRHYHYPSTENDASFGDASVQDAAHSDSVQRMSREERLRLRQLRAEQKT